MQTQNANLPEHISTLPPDIKIQLLGVNTSYTELIANAVSKMVQQLSYTFNLSYLDGITIALDYPKALAELDRGNGRPSTLRPTTENVQGVAMSPVVLRDGATKVHMLFDAGLFSPLIDTKYGDIDNLIYTIAHECAHVEVFQAFDKAFPNTLLRLQMSSHIESIRWSVSEGCWNEYAACRLSAQFGPQYQAYIESSLELVLQNAPKTIDKYFKEYIINRNSKDLLEKTIQTLSQVMTLAAYLIGHLAGLGLKLSDSRLASLISDEWFSNYYLKLQIELENMWANYGKWENFIVFTKIGDVIEEMLLSAGIMLSTKFDGSLEAHVLRKAIGDPDTI